MGVVQIDAAETEQEHQEPKGDVPKDVQEEVQHVHHAACTLNMQHARALESLPSACILNALFSHQNPEEEEKDENGEENDDDEEARDAPQGAGLLKHSRMNDHWPALQRRAQYYLRRRPRKRNLCDPRRKACCSSRWPG